MKNLQHTCLAALASICLPLSSATEPLDRFNDLSVGSDYPGRSYDVSMDYIF